MTTLGKILGGGMPVGAYGGRADVMDAISPVGPVYQAGTLSGNPLAMACGIATLKKLRETNPYQQLADSTQRLVEGLGKAASSAGIPHTIAHVGSMFTLFFNGDPVHESLLSDAQRHQAVFAILLGHDGSRRLFAVQPIRGKLRLGRTFPRRHRRDDCRGT